MNRLKKVFLLIIILLLVTGCKKSSTYDISLNGNSNSYYNWVYSIDDQNILKIVDESYYGDENEDTISGLGGTYTFKIQPLKQGVTTITFNYMRTWEDDAILYEYIVEFEVDKNLNLKELSENGNYLALMKFFDAGEERVYLTDEYSDYKMIFESETVSISGEECYLLSVYDYNDILINTYGISLSSDNIYIMIDDNMTLID